MILRQSSRRNGERTGARARGLAAALGIMTGNLAWMTGAALGLGAVVALVPAVLPVLKILGGAFLVWMGVSGLRSSTGAEAESAEPTEAEPEASQPLRPVRPDAALTSRNSPDRRTDRPGAGPGSGTGAAYVTGIATNLANPKALILSLIHI